MVENSPLMVKRKYLQTAMRSILSTTFHVNKLPIK